MIVVADASPLIGLVKIGQIEILPKLFGGVVIHPQVAAELTSLRRPAIVRELANSAPSWLSVRTPSRVESIPGIHAGELESH
jgi:predicted nucleic acid-binding protein